MKHVIVDPVARMFGFVDEPDNDNMKPKAKAKQPKKELFIEDDDEEETAHEFSDEVDVEEDLEQPFFRKVVRVGTGEAPNAIVVAC